MAQYIVLRDCYCEDRFFYKDSEMNLSEGVDAKYPKNFKLIEEKTEVVEPVAEKYLEDAKSPPKPITAGDITVSTPFFEYKEVLDYDNAPLYVSDKPKNKK